MADRREMRRIEIEEDLLVLFQRILDLLNIAPEVRRRIWHTLQGFAAGYGVLWFFPNLLNLPACVPGLRPTLT